MVAHGRGIKAKLLGCHCTQRMSANTATLSTLLVSRVGSAQHSPCLGPSAWQQDPLTHYSLQLLPMGPEDTTEIDGQSGARSATEAAGRGQSSPDLLLLPHHLLSFSLTLAGPPACPWLHQVMPLALGIQVTQASWLPLHHPACQLTPQPWARSMAGRTEGHRPQPRQHHPPPCPHGYPSTTFLAQSEFDGSQPSPSPGPLTALGLAGVWTCSSRGMSGTPVLPRGARRAPILQTGRPLPPAPWLLPPWSYHGKAVVVAQGERRLPGAPASSPHAARRNFSLVSSSAACPEGEVPA